MAYRKKICYLCGEHYKYCSSCSQDRMKPTWMNIFHEENCMKIFQTCTDYNMGLITKDEAQEILNACDLSKKDTFTEYVQQDIKNIFSKKAAAKTETK